MNGKKVAKNFIKVGCLLVLDYLIIDKLPGSNIDKVLFKTKYSFDTSPSSLYWCVQLMCKICLGVLAGSLAYINVLCIFRLLQSLFSKSDKNITIDEAEVNKKIAEAVFNSASNMKEYHAANVFFNNSSNPCNDSWVEYEWKGMKVFATQIKPNTLIEGVEYIPCVDTIWYTSHNFDDEYVQSIANEFASYETHIEIRQNTAYLSIMTVPSFNCQPHCIPRITIITKQTYDRTKKLQEKALKNKVVEFNKDNNDE